MQIIMECRTLIRQCIIKVMYWIVKVHKGYRILGNEYITGWYGGHRNRIISVQNGVLWDKQISKENKK